MLDPRCRGRGRTRSLPGRWLPLLAVVAVLAVHAAACSESGGSKPDAGDGGPPPGTPQKVLILHTNDIHSHLMGFAPEIDYTPATPNDDATRGGMARLAAAIGAAKASAAADGTPVLLLDAGDFMMGTPFEFLATTASPELAMMHALGYDATTIGNHELDWTPHGLAGILQAAVTNGVTFPILSSNMKFSAADPADDELEMLANAGVIQPKLVKMVGGLKVGFFGLLGANAVQVTPQAAPLTFDPIDVAAARMVKELRETDKVDLVVALSHSGIDHDGQGEDAVLAAKVPGIDVIVSGHTHDTLAQPAQVGNTLIVTAGAYTAYLGELALTVTPSGTPGRRRPSWRSTATRCVNIDDTIPGDPTTQAAVDHYIAGLDTALAPSGLAYKAVVATTAADLPLPARGEAPVGNLVTDAYRTITAAVQPAEPPVIAVDANGALRAPIIAGKTGDDLVRRSVPRHAARHRPRSDPGLFAGDVLSERQGHPERAGAGRRPRGGPERLLPAGLRHQGRLRHDEAAVRPGLQPDAGHVRRRRAAAGFERHDDLLQGRHHQLCGGAAGRGPEPHARTCWRSRRRTATA